MRKGWEIDAAILEMQMRVQFEMLKSVARVVDQVLEVRRQQALAKAQVRAAKQMANLLCPAPTQEE